MSFPKYAAYKDSGVEWMGEVPAHWDVTQIRRTLDRIEQGWSPECHGRPADAGEWGVLKSGCVNGGMFHSDENKALPEGLDVPLELEVRAGDMLMSRASGSPDLIGSIALVKQTPPRLLLSDKTFRIHVNRKMEASFFAWCLSSRALRGQIECAISGAAGLANNLPQSRLVAFVAAIPPLAEQQLIGRFLDHETTKIDALVEEQRRLIELLKEKRQAVISQAVTKGLDPSVPMKDSGVEWIGALPAHWSLLRVKDVAGLESGHTPSKQVPEYWENCDIPWVSLNDSKQLAASDYITETAFQISALGLANSSARMLPAGAVVFTRDATIGLAAITTRAMAVSQHLIAWCPSDNIDARYLLRVFNVMKQWLDAATFGATIKTIGMADVKKLVTPVPPIVEQRAIAAFIEERKSEFDSLIDAAERATSLLIERRSALISAAVTGKIDVRGFAPTPEPAAA